MGMSTCDHQELLRSNRRIGDSSSVRLVLSTKLLVLRRADEMKALSLILVTELTIEKNALYRSSCHLCRNIIELFNFGKEFNFGRERWASKTFSLENMRIFSSVDAVSFAY